MRLSRASSDARAAHISTHDRAHAIVIHHHHSPKLRANYVCADGASCALDHLAHRWKLYACTFAFAV